MAILSDFTKVENSGMGNCGPLAFGVSRLELANKVGELYHSHEEVKILIDSHASDLGISPAEYIKLLRNDGIEFGLEICFAYLEIKNQAVKVWFSGGTYQTFSKPGAPGCNAINILYTGGIRGHYEKLIKKPDIDRDQLLIDQLLAEELQSEQDHLYALSLSV